MIKMKIKEKTNKDISCILKESETKTFLHIPHNTPASFSSRNQGGRGR